MAQSLHTYSHRYSSGHEEPWLSHYRYTPPLTGILVDMKSHGSVITHLLSQVFWMRQLWLSHRVIHSTGTVLLRIFMAKLKPTLLGTCYRYGTGTWKQGCVSGLYIDLNLDLAFKGLVSRDGLSTETIGVFKMFCCKFGKKLKLLSEFTKTF
jgi:hypothetical protein